MNSTSVLRGRDDETFLSIDVTGSTGRTLTAVEYRARTLRFTGTLAAGITLRLPLADGDAGATWTLENRTTGGFTLTFTPITGTGVAVAPGAAMTAFFDGVNLVGQSAAAATGLPATVDGVSTLFPLVILDPVIGDAVTFDGTVWENSPAAAGGQLVIEVDGNVVLTGTEADATNIELRAGDVDAPFTVTFPDEPDGRQWCVENQTGQTCTLVGAAGEVYLVNDARCGLLWDGTTLTRTWLSTPTFFAIASTDPLDFATWDQVDSDYIEIIPVAGSITVLWPNGGSLGKRGRRQTIKNDHTSQWIDVKTDGAGAEATTRLLPGETASFVIDNSGAIVPDWTRAYERRVTVTHDDAATYTVLHPDFLAQVIVVDGALTATRNLILPTVSHKSWILVSAVDEALVVKTAAGTGVTLYPGKTRHLACDGTNIVPLGQATGGVERLFQRASDGQVTLGGAAPNANPGVTQNVVMSGTMFLNGLITVGDIINFVLGTGTGTKWGTAADQLQAWWGGTPGAQMVVTGDSQEEQLDSFFTQASARGLIAPYVTPLSLSPWLFIDPRNFTGAHDAPVGTLTDTSGNSRSATAAGGLRGLLQVSSNLSPNGSRTVLLDGVDDTYDHVTAMLAVGSGVMYTIAGNFTSNAGAGQVIFTDSGTQRPQLIVETAGTNLYAFRDEGHTHTFGAFSAGWQVLQWVFYPPSDGSGVARLYRNGVQVGTDSTWNWNPGASTGFIISGGTLPAKVALGPVIITPGQTGDVAREGLRAWIGARYGA
jgi:hypothetical protein